MKQAHKKMFLSRPTQNVRSFEPLRWRSRSISVTLIHNSNNTKTKYFILSNHVSTATMIAPFSTKINHSDSQVIHAKIPIFR